MPRVINLDALVVDTVTVNVRKPDGTVQTFVLKDDVPLDVGLLTFKLMQKEQDLQAMEASGGANKFNVQSERLQMLSDDVTHILGEIFRHTYPQTTDEELAALIPPGQGMEIVKAFFTSLTARFSTQPSSTDTASSTPVPAAPATMPSVSDPTLDATPLPSSSSEPEPEPEAEPEPAQEPATDQEQEQTSIG